MYTRKILQEIIMSVTVAAACTAATAAEIGTERAAERRLADGEEYGLATHELIDLGRQFFTASWTVQEGAGSPI